MQVTCATIISTSSINNISAHYSSCEMADPTAPLRFLLLSYMLRGPVVNFTTANCSRGLGRESISDFAGYWTNHTADLSWDIFVHTNAFKDKINPSKAQPSRWRIA